MLAHLTAITALGLTLAAWVYLRQWMRRQSPGIRDIDDGCVGCATPRKKCCGKPGESKR